MRIAPFVCSPPLPPQGTTKLLLRRAGRKVALLLSAIGAFSAATVVTAGYPDRPIRFIVPSAPGGGADIISRFFTAELAKQLGQQFVIDNRPGASGTIGVGMLVKSSPDGYTLGYGNMVYLSINRVFLPQQPYDVDKDVQPVTQFTSSHNLLAVRLTLPVRSVPELIDYAKKNPGKLTYASSGNGTTLHLSGELFKQLTSTQIVHVPYKAVMQAITDLIGGQIDLIFDNQTSVTPYVKAGRLRGLAVTGPTRATLFPELPTLAEAGVPGYEITTWGAMIAPAGVPKAVVARLSAETNKGCSSPTLKDNLDSIGSRCVGSTPEQFAEFLKKENAKWAGIVRRAGAKID